MRSPDAPQEDAAHLALPPGPDHAGWFYAALVSKCYMHDRHSGDPVTIPPVYGDDSSASEASEEEAEEQEAEQKVSSCAAFVRLLTWNTNRETDLQHVVDASKHADVMCLQEVTNASMEWLRGKLEETFDLLTPESCGGAWDAEGHGVAIAVRQCRGDVSQGRVPLAHVEV